MVFTAGYLKTMHGLSLANFAAMTYGNAVLFASVMVVEALLGLDRIDRALSERFGLSPSAATALRGEGEALEAGAADTVRFTKVLKDAVPLDDRAELMQTLWSVVLADGVRAAEEDQAMRIVASLLGLTDRQSGQARQRAEARR